MADRSNRRRWVILACVVACLAGCSTTTRATVVAPPPGPAVTVPVRVLQLNLCNSGIAGCFTGRSTDVAAGVIRAGKPDLVTLNEVCRADVATLERALAEVVPGGGVSSSFQPARDGRNGEPYRCRNGDQYGIGIVSRWPSVPGSSAGGGIYPAQDRDDPEERAWLCQDVAATPEVAVCTTHLAYTKRDVARCPVPVPVRNGRRRDACAGRGGSGGARWRPEPRERRQPGPPGLPSRRLRARRRRGPAARRRDTRVRRRRLPADRSARQHRPPGPARHAGAPDVSGNTSQQWAFHWIVDISTTGGRHAVRGLLGQRHHDRPHHRAHAERGRADQGGRRDRREGRGGRARRLRPRRAPQPAVLLLLAHDDAGLHRRADRAAAALDGDDADHHERPGEDRRGLRDAAAPRRRPGRPDAGPRQHRPGLPVVRPGHPRRHPARDRELRAAAPAVGRGRRRLGGQLPHAAAGLHLDAAPARRRAAVRLARLDPQPGDRRAGRLLRRRLLPQPHLLARRAHPADGRVLPPPLRALRPRPCRPGHRRARRAGVHAAQQPGRRAGVPAVLRQRAGLRARPVAGGLQPGDPADRGQPAAGHRAHARLPRLRRRLPAPAVPRRPRRACR